MSDAAGLRLPGLLAAAALPMALTSAFAHGGETLTGQGLVAAAGALGFAALALMPPLQWPRPLVWAAVCWAGLVGWCLIQSAPLGLGVHPAWPAAAAALGEPLAGAIALDPQAAQDAAVRLTAYAGLFAAGLAASRCGMALLPGLALGIAAIAGIALFAVGWDTGPAGLAKVRHWGDLSFPFASRNQFCVFAGLGAMTALAALAQTWPERTWPERTWPERTGRCAILAVALLLCLAAAFATHSRAGLAVVGLGLAVTAGLTFRPSRRVALAAAGLAALLALAFAAGTLVRLETLAEAAALRLDIISRAFALSLDHPLRGVGSFDLAFQAVASAYPEGLVQSAHNILAESLVERGWPATGLAILAIALTLTQATRRLAAATACRGRGALALGSAAMLLLHGMVDFSLHAPAIAAVAAMMVGHGSAPPQPAPHRREIRPSRIPDQGVPA